MRRGTTPTHTFTIPFDTSLVEKLRVVYAQRGSVRITKNEADVEMAENEIRVRLTQEDTLKLTCDTNVEIQVRVKTAAGDVLASEEIRVSVDRCLGEEVL